MKKLIILACATAAISLTTGFASAETIEGKIGVTGKAGFIFPSDGNNSTDTGIIGGGGFIFGIDRNFAAEVGITHTVFDSNIGDFSVTDLSLGAQYRFNIGQPKLVPFVGGGLDFLVNDVEYNRSVDSTLGVHIYGGADYFITKQFALTAEARVLLAPDVDINGPYGKQGDFDPSSLATTFGVRYFFN